MSFSLCGILEFEGLKLSGSTDIPQKLAASAGDTRCCDVEKVNGVRRQTSLPAYLPRLSLLSSPAAPLILFGMRTISSAASPQSSLAFMFVSLPARGGDGGDRQVLRLTASRTGSHFIAMVQHDTIQSSITVVKGPLWKIRQQEKQTNKMSKSVVKYE